MNNKDLNKTLEKIYQVLQHFGRAEMVFPNKIVFNKITITDNLIENDKVVSLDVEGERYDAGINDVGLLEAATFIVGKAAHVNKYKRGGNNG